MYMYVYIYIYIYICCASWPKPQRSQNAPAGSLQQVRRPVHRVAEKVRGAASGGGGGGGRGCEEVGVPPLASSTGENRGRGRGAAPEGRGRGSAGGEACLPPPGRGGRLGRGVPGEEEEAMLVVKAVSS